MIVIFFVPSTEFEVDHRLLMLDQDNLQTKLRV